MVFCLKKIWCSLEKRPGCVWPPMSTLGRLLMITLIFVGKPWGKWPNPSLKAFSGRILTQFVNPQWHYFVTFFGFRWGEKQLFLEGHLFNDARVIRMCSRKVCHCYNCSEANQRISHPLIQRLGVDCFCLYPHSLLINFVYPINHFTINSLYSQNLGFKI